MGGALYRNMNKKANTCGKVFDKMDGLCVWLLAYMPNCPVKYRKMLWEPLMHYVDQAQACSEMAYLETDPAEKFVLIKDARKYFRMFKRYQYRCDITGEFKWGKVMSLDMVEYIQDIEEELGRWFASQKKMLLVGNGAAAASPEHRV